MLRTSFKRRGFMAHALNLIGAGIVIKCSTVLQIGIYVMHRIKIKNFRSSLPLFFTGLIKVIAIYFKVLRTCRGSDAMTTIYVVVFVIIV